MTYVDHLPLSYHGWNQVEVDEGAIEPPDARGHRVSVARIDPDYFDALGVPVKSGRRFHAGDLQPTVYAEDVVMGSMQAIPVQPEWDDKTNPEE